MVGAAPAARLCKALQSSASLPEVTGAPCHRIMCWWSPRMPTTPATTRKSRWTSPMSSLAAVPALATTSGGPGPGAGWVGRAYLPRKGAHLCLSPHSSSSASPFCRAAAISLSLFYNNGAQPCRCHEAGATGPTCEPFGGQCPCRAHVIGRDCSRCATGYWGFPRCRRESHGRGCGHPLGARRTFQMLPERLGWWSWAPKLGWRCFSRDGLSER